MVVNRLWFAKLAVACTVFDAECTYSRFRHAVPKRLTRIGAVVGVGEPRGSAVFHFGAYWGVQTVIRNMSKRARCI